MLTAFQAMFEYAQWLTHCRQRFLLCARHTPATWSTAGRYAMMAHFFGYAYAPDMHQNCSRIKLCAASRDHYIPTTEDGIPTGQITPVKGTPFDFTEMKRIGKEIDETPAGYDHNWVLHGLGRQAKFSTKAGSVASEM